MGLAKFKKLGDWKNKRNNPSIKSRMQDIESIYRKFGTRLMDVEPYRKYKLRHESKHEKTKNHI